ncbi:hypothetical protein G9A89_023686 [Geosiphon pyriformis]|nr:hypothetical protein G9A89_023686 [Geosiphon pyriformis]
MAATEQGGIVSGHNPAEVNAKNPLLLFIIQTVIIICVTRGLNLALSRFRQPRVISEVLGGIILGPSVFGQIPHFMDNIFPAASLTYLNLVANLGLVLYLFLVGVELDLKLLTKRIRVSLTISIAGMVLPFALGAAVSYGLYNVNNLPNVTYGNFLLFMGVAMAITAFPVLARIITELNLLKTKVGLTALCAAVGDDVAAWILLALTVSIINSSNSLTALYVFMLAIGWTVVVFVIIRPIFLKLIVATNSNNTGPSLTMMALTLLLVLTSAFVTEAIGIHFIFGGFMVGVIIPHDGRFALGVTEKLEDLISILFLPIYFALSGLKTKIGLLNDATAWGYVFLVIFVAMTGKITGVTTVARLNKMSWRESFTIGIFMSCKGLVELIVLNIGLEAKVISEKVFAIMVVMAIVTTCLTSPLALWVYPKKYHKAEGLTHLDEEKSGKTLAVDSRTSETTVQEKPRLRKLLVVLNQIEYLPAMMTLIQLLRPSRTTTKPIPQQNGEKGENLKADTIFTSASPEAITINALRLIELTQRTTSIMQLYETEETVLLDPIMNVFRTFGQLSFINVKANLAVLRLDEFSEQVAQSAEDTSSDMIIIPWAGAGTIIQDPSNTHDIILGSREEKNTSPQVANFIQGVFSHAPTNVGIFVDRGLGLLPKVIDKLDENSSSLNIKVFLPFFGGADDREALSFVVRLLDNSNVTAAILRIRKSAEPTENDTILSNTQLIEHDSEIPLQKPTLSHQISAATIRSTPDLTAKKKASEEADQALLTQYFANGRGSIIYKSRLTYREIVSATPLQTAIQQAKDIVSRKDLVVVGRGRVDSLINHREEWSEVIRKIGMMGYGSDNLTRKSLGDLAEGLLVGGVPASVLIIQSSGFDFVKK